MRAPPAVPAGPSGVLDASAGIQWDEVRTTPTCLEALCAHPRVRKLLPKIDDIAAVVLDWVDTDNFKSAASKISGLTVHGQHAIALCPPLRRQRSRV